MLLFTLLLMCASALASVPRMQKPVYSVEPYDLKQQFEEFIATYDKKYAHEEEKSSRFEIFKENVAKINKKNSDPKETAIFVINEFADLSLLEFKQRYMGYRVSSEKTVFAYENITKYEDVPDHFDWREKNAVSRVKDQADCSSCWAFSVIGCVESAYAISHKSIQEFSEQQLIDCDRVDGGCEGGDIPTGIQYIIDAGGIEGESDYEYTATNGAPCAFDNSKIKAKVTKSLPYDLKNADDTKQFLVQNGPISIAIDAGAVHSYGGGILRSCPGNKLGHAVLLVGYGKEGNSDFWIIKNSWSEHFGEQGYFRVAYGKNDNPCGMYNNHASGVTVA